MATLLLNRTKGFLILSIRFQPVNNLATGRTRFARGVLKVRSVWITVEKLAKLQSGRGSGTLSRRPPTVRSEARREQNSATFSACDANEATVGQGVTAPPVTQSCPQPEPATQYTPRQGGHLLVFVYVF